jgi:ribosomal protein S18 acetylase RimI-like enzyme
MVGYCFGSLNDGEVVVLALLPEYEGKGIGKSLLSKVNSDLVKAGNSRLFLGCSSDPRSRSYGSYRNLGWRSTGKIDKNGDEILEYYP